MLAAIQPHCDDIPIFAGGTVLKLIDEGYEGILITVSDDAMAGDGVGYGEVEAKNEQIQGKSRGGWGSRRRSSSTTRITTLMPGRSSRCEPDWFSCSGISKWTRWWSTTPADCMNGIPTTM